MKCPYCGFVSFEYLNGCKKCSKDLSAHKSQFGIEYLEPVSLEMYAYAGGAAAAAGAISSMSVDESDGFGADDFGVDNESDSASIAAVDVADDVSFDEGGTADISIDFGGDDEGTEEVSIDIGDDAEEEISLDLGEAEPEKESALDLSTDSADEISLDLGEADSDDEISLDLGEADSADEISLDLGEADSDDEISLDLGEADSDDEISLDLGETDSADEISLDLGEADFDDGIALDVTEEEAPAVAEKDDEGIDLDFGDELGSDSGFSLDLGEEISDDTNANAIEDEITLDFDDEPAPAEPNASAPAEEDSIEIALDDVDTGDPDQTVAINRGDVEEIGDEAAPTADDDFADIELSIEDEDLFGAKENKEEGPSLDDEEEGLGLDTNLDLGDLSLEIGDDELGFDFDDTDAKLD